MRLLAALMVGLAVYGAATTQVAILLLGVVLALGLMAVEAMKRAQQTRSETFNDSLSNESRTMLRPLRRQRDELKALVSGHQTSAAVKIIGTDAAEEADRIVEHATRLLELRQQAKKMSSGRGLAEEQAAELELRLEGAIDPAERMALEGALSARKAEGRHYQPIEQTLKAIDSSLAQADAALAEMKARLGLALADEAAYVHDEEGSLNETISRLRSLNTSMDEAEELLRGRLTR